MNWIDTNVLVYASIVDHPATGATTELLQQGNSASSVLVAQELYQVLKRNYRVSSIEASDIVRRFLSADIRWVTADVLLTARIIDLRSRLGIETADAALLAHALDDRGVVVTMDRRLLQAAEASGLSVKNPVSMALASEVGEWEDAR